MESDHPVGLSESRLDRLDIMSQSLVATFKWSDIAAFVVSSVAKMTPRVGMSKRRANDLEIALPWPLLLLVFIFFLERRGSLQISEDYGNRCMYQDSFLGLPFLGSVWTTNSFDRFVQTLLLPLYATGVVVYLTSLSLRIDIFDRLQIFLHRLGIRTTRQWLTRKRRQEQLAKLEGLEQERAKSDALLPGQVAGDDPESHEQPINLSGAYKLISNDNFEGFLAVQGVPWALRSAANKARPTHRITHVGSRLTIKIEGIIESQTTYIINGPPVETNVRGRIFEDRVSYLMENESDNDAKDENNNNENAKCIGIIVRKKALTEDYDVTVQRTLSDDRQRITMKSTAYFRNGDDGDRREPVRCVQQFERIE